MSGLDKHDAVGRAQQLLRDKRFADALQVCNDELARGAEDAELRLVAAQSLLAQGRHEGAKKEAQQAVRLDPTLTEAHRLLGEVALTRGELAVARDHLNRVLELDPDDAKSVALLESLSRPIGVALANPKTPGRGTYDPILAALGGPPARSDESVPLELHSEDLEDDVSHVAELPRAQLGPNGLPVSSTTSESGAMELPISDSMIVKLPQASGSGDEDQTSPVLPEVQVPSSLALGGRASSPALGSAGVAARSLEAAWKPVGDVGVGGQKLDGGTLRLPALDQLPTEEDAPTMPLLRASVPKPQLRLDPLAQRPIQEQPLGSRSPGARSSRLEAPLGGRVAPPEASSSFEEFLEPASVPISTAAQPAPPLRKRSSQELLQPPLQRRPSQELQQAPLQKRSSQELRELLPSPAESDTDSSQSPQDLLAMLAGRDQQDSPLPDAPRAGRSQKRPSGPAAPLRVPVNESGRRKALNDSGPKPAVTGSDSDLLGALGLSDSSRAALTPDEIERQIASAAYGTAETQVHGTTRRRGGHSALRWVLVALIGLVVGGGGLAGYLYYQSWKFVQKEWSKLREEVHRSTADGYREARACAERILQRRKNDPKALAALAMCDAAMSIEFGDDRLKSAREFFERAKGQDSEWRTAAHAFLSLIDDPAGAAGYLFKALDYYPESALLHYLRGRALVASEAPDKAAGEFKGALKLAPKYVAARIGLVALEGQNASGYAEAVRALDDIVASDKDCLQALIERARLRARHGKDLDAAATDARRVTSELAAKAGRGQRGWAHLVLAQVTVLTAGGNKQKWAAVNEELDAAISSPPCCDSAFRHELAGELMKVYRMADAQAQMKEALALKPKHPEYLQRMARIFIELDDPVAALAELQNAPARHPETRLLTGRALLQQGAFIRAADAFKTVLAENKDNLEAAIYLQLAKARRGAVAEAVGALEQLAEANASNPEPLKALGRLELAAGDLAKAEAALKAAWKLTKIDPSVPTLLGQVSMKRYEIEAGQKRFQRALEIRKDYRPARIGLAMLMMAIGDLAEARKQAELISAPERRKPDTRALQVRIEIADGKLDAARTALSEAESSGLAPAQLERLTGELAVARKQGKVAEEALRKALKLGGKEIKDAELLVTLGRAELLSNKIDDAYDTFHDAIKEDAGNPLALLEIGRIAVKDGDHANAIKRLTEALAKMKQRQYPKTLLASAHTLLGAAYLKRKDTGRAITSLQDAIELDGSAAEPQFLMAQTYDALNHPQRSIQHYLKALQLDSSRTDIYEPLGRAYAKTGEAASAVKYLSDFLRTNPPPAKVRVVKQELKKLQAE